jgi:hypothetical protein
MQDNKSDAESHHDMLPASPPLAIYLPPTVQRLAGDAAEGAKFRTPDEDSFTGPS